MFVHYFCLTGSYTLGFGQSPLSVHDYGMESIMDVSTLGTTVPGIPGVRDAGGLLVEMLGSCRSAETVLFFGFWLPMFSFLSLCYHVSSHVMVLSYVPVI